MNSCLCEPDAPHCRATPESVALARALAEVLPAKVRFATAEVEVRADEAKRALAEHAVRFSDEAALIERAVPKRLFEFLASRGLARQLLADFGEPPRSLLRGPLGAPLWPRSVVGTIAHSNGMIVVVVGSTQDYSALGIDLEPNQPLPPDVVDHISLPGESEQAPQSRAVFVVKEAFYKAHSTLHGRLLDFTDVRVIWHQPGWSAREIAPPSTSSGPTSLSGTLTWTAEWLAAFCSVRT